MKKILLAMLFCVALLYAAITISTGFPFLASNWSLDHLVLFITGCSAIISIGGCVASFKYGS